jgi:hypothetical protein
VSTATALRPEHNPKDHWQAGTAPAGSRAAARAYAVQPGTARRAQLRGDRFWLANQPRQSTRTNFKVLATTKRVDKRLNDLYQHQEGTLGYLPEPKHAATLELDFTERTRQHGLAKLSNNSENTTPRAGLQHELTFELPEQLASDCTTRQHTSQQPLHA